MTIKEQIIKTIERSNPGSIYFNNSFPKYDDVYVRQILSELCSQGVITRISNGIYVKPILSKFGIVFPPINDIVRAKLNEPMLEFIIVDESKKDLLINDIFDEWKQNGYDGLKRKKGQGRKKKSK